MLGAGLVQTASGRGQSPLIKWTKSWGRDTAGPGGRDATRIVTGSDGSAWYTDDHYATFTQIR